MVEKFKRLDELFQTYYEFDKIISSFIITISMETEIENKKLIVYTKAACDLLIWLQNNDYIEEVRIIQSLDYGCENRVHCIFYNKKIARKFEKWIKKHNNQLKHGNEHFFLWSTHEDFDQTIEDNGKITISESVEYEFEHGYFSEKYSLYFTLNEETFDLYKWMTNNLNGNIWYWSEFFRFELREDAIAFKLYTAGAQK